MEPGLSERLDAGFQDFIRNAGKLFAVLLGFVFLVVLYLVGTNWYENLPVTHDTPVWIHGDWMVGEYRNCEMLTTPQGAKLKPEVQAELPRLFCGDRGVGKGGAEFLNEFRSDSQASHSAADALLNWGDWSEFDSMFHVFPVRYHGRIHGAVPNIEWSCQRLSTSLECKPVK